MTRPRTCARRRAGYKYGAMELLDAMALDGLTDPFEHTPMGELTDAHNKASASDGPSRMTSLRSHIGAPLRRSRSVC